MKRTAGDIELNHDDDISDDVTDKNPELSQQLALVTGEQRVSKKPKIINEPIVDQDHVDCMEDVVSRADMRKKLGLFNGKRIEIKWNMEYEDETQNHTQWFDAVITNIETGKTHRFVDDKDPDNSVDAPVITVLSEDETEADALVFFKPHELYHIGFDSVLLWRNKGDDYDEDTDDEDTDDDSDEETDEYKIVYNNDEELEACVLGIVTSAVMNVCEANREQYNALSIEYQQEVGKTVLKAREVMVEKLTKYFKENTVMGNQCILKNEDFNKLYTETIEEITNPK